MVKKYIYDRRRGGYRPPTAGTSWRALEKALALKEKQELESDIDRAVKQELQDKQELGANNDRAKRKRSMTIVVSEAE
ncbi:hypothetical protein A2U01_0048627 [Trifolium medium]|uniref:Uncharacterized protein n=1 Tax=Trifolium medium TaxID=97028 RepID=A0A392QT16_9FABA|nr:hypothetical protein [Trifolium medium]